MTMPQKIKKIQQIKTLFNELYPDAFIPDEYQDNIWLDNDAFLHYEDDDLIISFFYLLEPDMVAFIMNILFAHKINVFVDECFFINKKGEIIFGDDEEEDDEEEDEDEEDDEDDIEDEEDSLNYNKLLKG